MKKDHTLSTYTWVEHFSEFKKRVLYILIPFLLIFIISYIYASTIYDILVYPLKIVSSKDQRLIYTGLAEAFMSYIKIALWTSFFITCPLLLNQIWKFITPGLYKHEKKRLRPYLIITPILFYLGAALAYFYIFPLAWKFFLSFEQSQSLIGLPIQLEAKMSEYLSISMTLIIAFGLSFEFPLIILLLNEFNIITYDQLKVSRKYFIVFIFIIAAILTPPDIVSQIGLAIPLMLFYELTLIWINFKNKQFKTEKNEKKTT